MSKRSCRVYLCTHEDGSKSGMLLSRARSWFSPPDPSAYANDEDAVLLALEVQLAQRMGEGPDELARFLWDEDLNTQRLRLDVPMLTGANKRFVIGKRKVPLQVTYAHCELSGGGYRVLAPRFEVAFVVEDLTLAPDILRHALTQLLLGERPEQLYDLRPYREEYVRDWRPSMLRGGRAKVAYRLVDQPTLAECADDLVARARSGRLAHVLGEDEQAQTLVASEQLTPGSILLLGPPGVGKSAWVRAVAHKLTRAPGRGMERKLWSTSADRLVSGLPYLGQWQERCLELVNELSYEGDLLHLDHLAAVVQPIHGEASIADFLAEPIQEAALTVIIEATAQELDLARRLNPSFISRLRIVRIQEPDTAEIVELLTTQAERRGRHKIHPLAYKRLLRHLDIFARESALPGKALRFLDWLNTTPQPDLPDALYANEISRAYSHYSGIPFSLLADDQPKSREDFARELAARVIGQDHACDVAARALARLKASMTDPDRPTASFLFVGPTGVGKTELAKQLTLVAFGTDKRLIRFDMSEYMYPGSAARLLDASRGVRSLVNAVREQPLAVVLFDEIEKAHPQVFDLMLSLLDEGRTTDTAGRPCDLRSTMIVMTSNLGVRDRPSVGFGNASEGDSLRAVRAHFRPEFWNRIDYVVPFRALSLADVEKIVRLEIDAINARDGMTRRRVRLRVSESAISALAERSYDPLFGARPLKRVIEEQVVAKVAARLAAEPGLAGVEVAVVSEGEDASGWVLRV
jgi:ATP-dependent Clp protease ATP-binding subunit ClpC